MARDFSQEGSNLAGDTGERWVSIASFGEEYKKGVGLVFAIVCAHGRPKARADVPGSLRPDPR